MQILEMHSFRNYHIFQYTTINLILFSNNFLPEMGTFVPSPQYEVKRQLIFLILKTLKSSTHLNDAISVFT